MVTERVDILFQSRGAKVVRRDIDGVGRSSQKSSKSVGSLKGAIVALASSAVLIGTIRLADSFTNLQNRLKLVTDGTKDLSNVTQDLLDISTRTRSSFESNADLFSRVALSVKDLGISQRETLNFTESLNKAVILSGASATEASAGLIQLSQGLASGALRGDELRSVLEQLPVVADVISKELGITRGELRVLGSQGKITSDIIIRSFKSASKKLDEDFAETVATVGQAFTVLKNSAIIGIAEIDKATGATSSLATAIISIADAIVNSKEAMDGFFSIIKDGTKTMTDFLGPVLKVQDALFKFEGKALDATFKGLTGAFNAVKGVFTGSTESIGETFSKAFEAPGLTEVPALILDASTAMGKLKTQTEDLNVILTTDPIDLLPDASGQKAKLNLVGLELKKIHDSVSDLATNVGETLSSSFQNAEDALVDFVTTGKLGFRDLVNSILNDIARLAIRQAVIGPLTQALGGAFGGLFSGGGGGSITQVSAQSIPTGLATGGSFGVGGSGGTDSQLVQFRATPGENVNVTRPGQPTGANVLVNVINNGPGEARAQESRTADGGRSIDVIIDEVVGKKVNQPGSQTNKALTQNFGLQSRTNGR